ncbi:hypothetical protein NVP1121O_233 [Vibrio phage 1.121.O._10N.286.46.C4]|nr:hypothetical protein NVP1121O_233 [Vibrio phage 1.121.O._10N.286.46.C4]
MSHECIYCGAELTYEDTFGVGAHWIRDNTPAGYIYRCPNHEGFSEESEGRDYLAELGGEVMLPWFGWESWQDVVCDSSVHNVSGYFYVYVGEENNLKEGYPC